MCWKGVTGWEEGRLWESGQHALCPEGVRDRRQRAELTVGPQEASGQGEFSAGWWGRDGQDAQSWRLQGSRALLVKEGALPVPCGDQLTATCHGKALVWGLQG